MNVPAKLAGFALVLVAAFGVGVGIGAAVGPLGDTGKKPVHVMTQNMSVHDIRKAAAMDLSTQASR